MQWFYNLRISKKLMLSFLLLAIIAGILGYVGIKEIRSIQTADTKLYEENTQAFVPVNNVAVAFQMRRVQLKDMLLKDDLARRQENVDRIAELDKNVSEYMLELKEHVQSPEMSKGYTDLQDALQLYQSVEEEYIRLVMANQLEEATAVTTGEQGVTASKAVETALTNFTQTIIKEAQQKAESNTEIAYTAVLTMIVLILISVAIALLLGWFIARIISRPLQDMVTAADKLALGNINVQVAAETTDEIGILAKSFTAMIENIREQALVAERIAAGDLSIQVLDKSEHDILARSMNLIVETLRNLLTETDLLTRAAVNGKLDIRGDINKFNGSYQEIIKGVNNALDAFIEPIQESAGILQEMAQGNLQQVMSGEYKGDFNEIKNALNNTLRSLNEVLGEINEAAVQVASGAGQVADSSQALSQASTEQASSVQEITATMTEISSQTKQNALNANRANEMAVAAQENAIQGNQEMQEMLKAMSEINESSTSISKIIKVIDEIAFQTNILALNAAVEAARAGQHGKGFAVVAEEVRNLAARSANAAKETTVMIEGSINKVESGTKMATGTAAALNKIMDGVSNVANLVGEIAAASNEQATAIAQVNQGIAGILKLSR